MTLRSVLHCALCAAAFVFASCSTHQSGEAISRVKIYRMDPDKKPDAADPAIAFEHRHRLYGAVSEADRRARKGNYYTFFWSVPDTSRPVTVKFEYRQSATGFQTHQQNVVITDVTKQNKTEFSVVGDAFRENGRILGWRATLVQGGKVVGEKKSYLWD